MTAPMIIAQTPATAADSAGVSRPAYIPPRIIIGVKSAGNAFTPAINFSRLGTLLGLLIFLHFMRTRTIINTNRIRPGIIPAANVWETGTFVNALNSIAAFEGGIRASRSAAEAARTTTKGLG